MLVVAGSKRDLDQPLERVLDLLRAGVVLDEELEVVPGRVGVLSLKERLAEQEEGVVIGAGVRPFLDDVEENGRGLLKVLETEQHLRVEDAAIRQIDRRRRSLLELLRHDVDALVEIDELARVIVDLVGPSQSPEGDDDDQGEPDETEPGGSHHRLFYFFASEAVGAPSPAAMTLTRKSTWGRSFMSVVRFPFS